MANCLLKKGVMDEDTKVSRWHTCREVAFH